MINQIAIIGAGIGGLTTALALKQKNCQITIYESASEIKPVGAGIGIGNNAMQVFQRLGIRNKIEKAGTKVSSMNITDEKLYPLSVMKLEVFERRYNVHNVAIHRSELQKILAEEIGFENIRLSKRLVKIEQNEETVTMFFEDQSIERAAVVIAADGIKSIVRKQLFAPSEIRDTQQLCWRGICDTHLPDHYLNKAIEAWGKGKRFGFVKISDEKTYWYAVVNEWQVNSNDENLCEPFKHFHPDIVKIIRETSKEDIILNKITDLKPISKWYNKNICLLGDAAHATTPNLGQGACQAIEDAYALGQLYDHDKPIEQLFKEYEELRIKKAQTIVKTSWTIGKIAHIENNLGIFLRNTLIRSIPKSISKKQLKSIFDISYITKPK